MPLRADDVQAAERAHLLGLRRDLRLVLFVELRKGLAGFEDLLVVGVAVGRGLADQLLGHLHAAHFGARHEFGVAAQQDVRAAAGHVRRDRDGALAARLRDDLGFLLVVFRVEHLVLDAAALEHRAQLLGLLDRDRADQHRLALFVVLDDVFDDGVEFALFGLVDDVRAVLADHRLVRRDLDDVELVDLAEFGLLGHRGAGHAGELVVQAEEVLEGDRRERLALARDLHVFLRLDRLVQALVVAAAVHEAAGEFVDDDDLAVAHDVVDVALHDAVGLDRLVDVVLDRDVVRVGQVVDVEVLLGLFHAALRERAGLLLLVDDVVVVLVERVVVLFFVGLGDAHRAQRLGEAVGHAVQLRRLLALAGDDERGAGLVDEDRVHLVDDRVIVAALHLALLVGDHVVAQVVEAELVVRRVGDVARVRLFLFLGAHAGDREADRQAEVVEHAGHHLALVLGEVVVDRDDVHALAGQRVEVGRQRGGEGFAFAGLHFGDAALVQDDAADDLHGERLDREHAPHGLAAGGERLGQNVVERGADRKALLERFGLALELVVGHFCVFVVEREHGFLERLDALELLFAVVAEQLCEYIHMLNTVLSSGCAHSKIMRFGIFRIHIHFSIARAAGKKQESARIFIKTSRKAKLRFTQNRPIAGPPAGRGYTVQGMNRAAGGRRAPGGTGLQRMRRGA